MTSPPNQGQPSRFGLLKLMASEALVLLGLIIVLPIGLALSLLCLIVCGSLLIAVLLPLMFVVHVVPRLIDFLERSNGRDTASSMSVFRNLPPEVLQEVFIYCCDNEYVDFFYHFSSQPEKGHHDVESAPQQQFQFPESSRRNMVYTLKGVCRRWKLLVERTPALWRKVQLGSHDRLDYGDDRKDETHFRSLQHCVDMMERVLLPRSAGMLIQLRIVLCAPSFHTRHPESRCIHMDYTLPLLNLLGREGHRWGSLAVEKWCIALPPEEGTLSAAVFRQLRTASSAGGFSNLKTLTLHAQNMVDTLFRSNLGHHLSLPPHADFSQSAPRISTLVLLGSWHLKSPMGGIMKNLIVQWSHITTLVMNLRSWDMTGFEDVIQVLQAVRHNLVHLTWVGYRPSQNAPDQPPRDFHDLTLYFHSLRSLTLAEDGCLFSTTLLPRFTCPKLEVLRLFWPTPEELTRKQKPSLAGPISSVKQLLCNSPSLRSVTIVQGPKVCYLTLRRDELGEGSQMKHGHLIFRGNSSTCRALIGERLCKDVGFSSHLTLLGLSKHSPELVKRVLSRTMAIVPWFEYSTDKVRRTWATYPSKTQTAVHPFRPTAKTPWERHSWCPPSAEDWSPILQRIFSFVEDISSSVSMDISADTCILQKRAFDNSMPLSNLCILASIFDMVRAHDPPTSFTPSPDDVTHSCTFTIAVPL